ncbi:MAG: OmpH family outer membrane protein, partial [Deltaproteobacteria bacterium]|nr:OmpH family outer membrane protein [Deltaproteobacteria bacterium]
GVLSLVVSFGALLTIAPPIPNSMAEDPPVEDQIEAIERQISNLEERAEGAGEPLTDQEVEKLMALYGELRAMQLRQQTEVNLEAKQKAEEQKKLEESLKATQELAEKQKAEKAEREKREAEERAKKEAEERAKQEAEAEKILETPPPGGYDNAIDEGLDALYGGGLVPLPPLTEEREKEAYQGPSFREVLGLGTEEREKEGEQPPGGEGTGSKEPFERENGFFTVPPTDEFAAGEDLQHIPREEMSGEEKREKATGPFESPGDFGAVIYTGDVSPFGGSAPSERDPNTQFLQPRNPLAVPNPNPDPGRDPVQNIAAGVQSGSAEGGGGAGAGGGLDAEPGK